MRELNRTLVLDVIKQRSPVSRASIARETSLAKPTVSAIVEDLVGEGLVREVGVGPTASGGGRPPILLEFNARSQFLVGVQIGVRRTNLVIADALGQEMDRVEINTPPGLSSKALGAIADQIEQLIRRSGAARKRLAAVGVCLPGLVDMHTGTCLLAPNLDWHDVPISDLLSDALGVPVSVVNTSHAAAVVETIEGAAHGAENVVLLYVGRGVGAGVISQGRLLHGSFGLTGEIGHCHVPGATTRCNCGKIGCLETLTDGPAIVRAAVAALEAGRDSKLGASPASDLSAKDVADAAADGDELAIEILADAGRRLGLAASWLINLFNPEVLLVGGGVAEAGQPLLGPLEEAARQHTLGQAAAHVAIRPWTLGRDAGVRGAILVALQNSESYYRLIFQD
ncbi:MAG: ROK family protein [Actinobacteria bacterium]|nr:ROK family protein [Actinomycetota bacterium]